MGESRPVGRLRAAFVAIFLCFTTADPAAASPWARESGRLFVLSRASYFASGAQNIDRFQRFETDTYAEYGLGRRTTIGGKVIYGTSWISSPAGAQTATGFSEYESFVQREILRGPKNAVSIKLAAGAAARLGAGVRPGLESDGADVELRVQYGRNLIRRPLKVFSAFEAGYRRRFGDSADQVRVDLLIGFEPSRRILILIETFSTISMQNQSGPAANPGADYDILKVQPSAVWRVGRRWALQAGVTYEAAGRNLTLGNTYFVGLWSEF